MKSRFATFCFSVSLLLFFPLFLSTAIAGTAGDDPAAGSGAGNIDAVAVPPAKPQPPAGGEAEKPITVYEQKSTPAGLEPVQVLAILQTDEYGRKFTYPRTLYYDVAARELYVVATNAKGEGTIFVFDKNYYPTALLGTGRGIRNPQGLAVDKEGQIYVAWIDISESRGRSRLTIFNPAFFKNREFNISALSKTESYEVEQLALGHDDKSIYLAGYSNAEGGARGALVLDAAGKVKHWLVPLNRRDGLALGDDPYDHNALQVKDVVVDSNGRIYLLCPEIAKIFVLDAEDNLLFTFGTSGGSTGRLSRPKSLAVDVPRQVIYVVDYMRHSILLYRYDGTYLFEIGGGGRGPGWFNFPDHVELDGKSNLIVADLFNNRVQVLEVP